nr:hypothetical protein Ade03nite_37760 [Actinoplanes derwentensis]
MPTIVLITNPASAIATISPSLVRTRRLRSHAYTTACTPVPVFETDSVLQSLIGMNAAGMSVRRSGTEGTIGYPWGVWV